MISFKINTNKLFSAYILSVYLLLTGICSIFYLFIEYDFILYFSYLYKIPAPITFLIGPLAYLYIRATLYNESGFKKIDFLHLLPFIVFTLNYLPFYLMPLADKDALVLRVVEDFSLTYLNQDGFLPEWVNIVARSLLSMFYLGAQWRLLKLFYKTNKQSNLHFIKVKNWLFLFFKIQFFYWIGLIAVYLINGFNIANVSQTANFISTATSTVVTLFFFALSGVLLYNPVILLGLNNPLNTHSAAQANSGYDPKVFEHIHATLLRAQLFTNTNLNLAMAAQESGVSQRNISIAISDQGYDNFNDYINSLRAEEVCKKLTSEDLRNFSIETIGEKSGFNSKATFYRAFKKKYHKTPTEFLKTIKNPGHK